MTEPIEQWVTVPIFPDHEISNTGQIRRKTAYKSTYVGRILRPYLSKGYYSIRIMIRGKYTARTVHSLVDEAFLGPRPTGAVINHRDGDKTNNNVDNLEYVTPAENSQHAYTLGLMQHLNHWRADPEKVHQAQIKRLTNMRPDANRGMRNGAYTHPETRLRGAAHGCAKYTREQLQQAVELLSQDLTNREVSRITGIREDTVSNIKRGKHWINKAE